jgi:hypothetical protein
LSKLKEFMLQKAVPWVRRLVAGFKPRSPRFDTEAVVRFLVNKVAFEPVLRELRFPLSVSLHQCSIPIFIVTTFFIRNTCGRHLGNFKQSHRRQLDRKAMISGFPLPEYGASSGCRRRRRLPAIEGILNKQPRTADKG